MSSPLKTCTKPSLPKLVRRHPHVFGEAQAADATEVLGIWQDAKAKEKTNDDVPKSLLGGLPKSMPALMESQAMQERASRVGFEWPDTAGILDKLREELDELARAEAPDEQREELGDLLFVLVDWARWHGFQAEDAMRAANAKFRRRFAVVEGGVAASGRDWKTFTLDDLDAFWQAAKAGEKQ